MVFTLRVQTPNGLKRLEFSSVENTWKDLQESIHRLYGIRPSDQRISLHPLHKGEFVTASPDQPFAVLGFVHGQRLYLQEPLRMSQEGSNSFKLSRRCQHGPKGRCLHCSAAPVDYKVRGSCNHGTKAKCPNCSEHVQSGSTEVAEWLCNHSEDAFCPNCIPPEELTAKEWKKTCSCSNGQKCSECLSKGAVFKVDIIPYAQLMAENRSVCKYKHDSSTVCHLCAPPEPVSYKGDSNCTMGHRPWPLGICGRCRPPNAIVALQQYRHCDGISWKDTAAGNKFVSEWQVNPGLQRAALLFGKYIDEPEASNNVGAVRAEVYSLYCPLQRHEHNGVEFMHDPNESNVMEIARVMGLEVVGWAITTLPRSSDRHGRVFMSGREVRQAARFQSRFSDQWGHSRFVSMVVEYNDEGQVEPSAYQISDQGMAMERDGILQEGSTFETVSSRKGKDGEYVPSVIYKNRPLEPGDDFLPDELLVKVISMKPYQPSHVFEFIHFPFENATDADLRGYLSLHESEEFYHKFSDFNVLCYLPRVIGLNLACKLAVAVKNREKLDRNVQSDVLQKLMPFMN